MVLQVWGHSKMAYQPGLNRTLHLLRQQFWWLSMVHNARLFITACSVCACRRSSHQPPSLDYQHGQKVFLSSRDLPLQTTPDQLQFFRGRWDSQPGSCSPEGASTPRSTSQSELALSADNPPPVRFIERVVCSFSWCCCTVT